MTSIKEAWQNARKYVSSHADAGGAAEAIIEMDKALGQLESADARERIARAICQSGKFETGEGTCALICMDQLGDVRKKGCGHCTRVHNHLTDAILATGLVPDEATSSQRTILSSDCVDPDIEAAIRADEREKCAKAADDEAASCLERSNKSRFGSGDVYRHNTAYHSAAHIAAAIRAGRAEG